MTLFGDKLREYRLAKGKSLRKTADELGVSPAYLSDIERNRRNPPGNITIIMLCNILEIDCTEMLSLANATKFEMNSNCKACPYYKKYRGRE